MNMPKPEPRIADLAERLIALSGAIAALRPITVVPPPNQPPIPPGMQFKEDELTGQAANELRMLYLDAREEFERRRAEFEHEFMTWHSNMLSNADYSFTGTLPGEPSQAVPANKDEPAWVGELENATIEAALSGK